MIQLHSFVFNDFLENTYILWDETKECIIVDPGCYYENEREDLKKFIEGKGLSPVLLLNTHCHVDHIFGNKFVKENFKVPFYAHSGDLFLLDTAPATGNMYGLQVDESPRPDKFLEDGDEVKFGNTTLKVLFTPGHSPGSISFLYEEDINQRLILSGDVLFQNSIGRFDLPRGDYEILMQSIFKKLLVLDDDVKVFSGHGPATTIGAERKNNPFVIEYEEAMKVK